MKKAFYKIALIVFILPSASIAQDNAAEQKLLKIGYLLSAASVKLSMLKDDISEIRKKSVSLNELNNSEICHISLLMENIFWIETMCIYESLLLNALQSMDERKKFEQYKLHYSWLKKDTLKKMYLNFKATQSNFANIDDKEIINLSDNVKTEMLHVLSLIEEVISVLQSQLRSTP